MSTSCEYSNCGDLFEHPYHEAVDIFRRELIARALALHQGNRTQAARTLDLQRTYLVRLIAQLGLPKKPRSKRRRRAA